MSVLHLFGFHYSVNSTVLLFMFPENHQAMTGNMQTFHEIIKSTIVLLYVSSLIKQARANSVEI